MQKKIKEKEKVEIKDEEKRSEKIAEEKEKKEKQIVVPGETIVSGIDYLAGEGCMREGNDIIAIKYGLATIENNLVKVIPLGGVYIPRVDNVVIGEIVDITFNGWVVNIFSPQQAFLPLTEVTTKPKLDISEYYEIGDVGDILVLKVKNVQLRSVTLTMKGKGLGKINSGLLIRVSPSRVARIIGKKGSMVTTIKEVTKTKIVVGQNGLIWIKGEDAESEFLAKEAIELVAENPLLDGLTEKIKEYLEKKMNQKIKN